MRWSDNVWFGVFRQRTSSEERCIFLHVMDKGDEVLSLSPHDIWRLPKDDTGTSLLKIR
jgi:hypothetical protein